MMEYESPYIIIRLSEQEDVITLSIKDKDPDDNISGGTWGPFF